MPAMAAAAAAGKPSSASGEKPTVLSTEWSAERRLEAMMARLWAVLAVVVTFLVVAPVLESGTPNHMHVFQAVGDACDGGGGGGW